MAGRGRHRKKEEQMALETYWGSGRQLRCAAAKDVARPLELGLYPFEERYPALAAWCGRIEELPGYDRTYPPHWRAQGG